MGRKAYLTLHLLSGMGAFINTGVYLSTVEFMIFICVYIYIYIYIYYIEPDWGPLNPKIDSVPAAILIQKSQT